jgi:hypothetical protein
VSDFQLDPRARARVQVACDVVNKEIGEQRRNIVIVAIAVTIVAIPLLGAFREQTRPILFGAVTLVGLMFAQARRSVSKTYKTLVVGRVVKALGEGLTYTAKSSLDEKAFLGLELFSETPTHFESEDEIGGRKATVSYSVHEVLATRKEGKQTVTIFGGLVVRLDFNKNFRGRTSIVPQGAGNAGSSLLGKLFGKSPQKAAVTLENPDFERIFDVYSTDDQEARYILTPKLMELVLAANAAQGEGELRLGFRDNSLYVTIPSRRDHLEANLFQTVTPDAAIGDLAQVIGFAEKLVDEFQLETRIWSRA